jgi:hypothetical protein
MGVLILDKLHVIGDQDMELRDRKRSSQKTIQENLQQVGQGAAG